MSKPVRATKVTIDDIVNNNLVLKSHEYINPKFATILTNNSGTLCRETEDGPLYLVLVGDWFRASLYNLPQIKEFDQLADYNLTILRKQTVTITPAKDEDSEITPEPKEVDVLVKKEKAVKQDKKPKKVEKVEDDGSEV